MRGGGGGGVEVKLNASHLFWTCFVPLAAVTGNANSVSVLVVTIVNQCIQQLMSYPG